ncbi:MAG: ROK family protein [Anaerolineaceae bacterium]|nr:ROK family protein [Anaerolineaceae bacterium]
MGTFVGVDLGGTNLRAGVVDSDTGSVLILNSTPTLARQGHLDVVSRIAELILSTLASTGIPLERVGGIGIGVPGVLDLTHGLVKFLPNLPGNWLNVPLSSMIAEKIGRPTVLLNDVRSITYGEWKFGAGKGVDNMACYAIGTGIGGGIVINGRLFLGIEGTAGEFGHQTIDLNGPVCGCGNRGCLEAFASGPAISALGIKAVIQGLTTNIGQLAGFDLNKITPELICEAAKLGDNVAKGIYEQVGQWLGVAISNTIVSFGPKKVVISGGVAAAGDILFEPIRQTVRQRVRVMPVEQVEILAATLGPNAGVIGSAMWAAQNLKSA